MKISALVLSGLFVFVVAGTAAASPFGVNAHSKQSSAIIHVDDDRDVVHDSYGGVVHTEGSGTCVRISWENNSDVCAPKPFKVEEKTTQSTATLTREERTIYFGFNLADISPEMKQHLDSLAASLRSNSNVKGARIVGYADRIGTPDYNLRLSQKRAENVKNYLLSKGVINTRATDIRWLGSEQPVSQCDRKLRGDNLINCLQKDRRVEVEVDYVTDQRAAR